MEPTLNDLTELKRLLALGSTPYVEALLKAEIEKIEPKFATKQEEKKEEAKPAGPVRRYQSITSYAFSDSKDKAEIMIREIRGLEQAKIEFEPVENGFSIAVIREEQNLPNLKLVVSPTKPIKPEESKYKVRRETLTVILAKKKEETWMKLKDTSAPVTKEDKKKKEEEEIDAKENPNAALMNMMKKMYDEGDDEMKRTISKAMWEAQHKKPEDEKKP